MREGFADVQLADMAAIGLDWDGEVVSQSSRTSLYAEALSRLPVYECFCTRAEIQEAASAAHGPVGAYPGTCLSLTASERAERRAAGRVPALRVRTGGPVVSFDDRVLGSQRGVRR